ncbi:MAG: trehalose-6-phosphate synthase [Euryarchaeota archaeon]|nr:trehalose-6-phosphate synthase [Euryarchaeota archaeon]
MQRPRLIVASNRLPFSLRRDPDGWQLQESTGGLVAALGPILRERGGVWIGWPGTSHADAIRKVSAQARKLGCTLHPVALTARERERFYNGFANEVVWPLFHDLQTFCNFQESYWVEYANVNRKFARAIREEVRPGDNVWVHDYHLMGVGDALRGQRNAAAVRFFLHIPFPPVDIFRKLPWRLEVLDGFFAFDQVGFQTPADLRNFLQCVETLRPDVRALPDGPGVRLEAAGRTVNAGTFPIGVDAARLAERARSRPVEARVGARHSSARLIFGIDRLDYTKGVPHKLRAYERLLDTHPEFRRRVTLLQVVSPSRETIPRYHDLKGEIEGLVGRINGEFAEPGWIPIQYLYRRIEIDQLLTWYRSAEVALVTPLRDGMNLVAKEYCAANLDGRGVLVLSEFAGAAPEFRRDALLVNPYSVEEVSKALHQALTMPAAERRTRMENLRREVFRHDLFWWVDRVLAQGGPDERPPAAPRPRRTNGTPAAHDVPSLEPIVARQSL